MEKSLKKKLTIIFILLVFSLIFIMTSMMGFLKPSNELAEVWFQRSGSIAVALAIFAEVGLVSFSIKQNKLLTEGLFIQELQPWIDRGELLAKTMLVVGTLVWGYGDLIYQWLSTLLG